LSGQLIVSSNQKKVSRGGDFQRAGCPRGNEKTHLNDRKPWESGEKGFKGKGTNSRPPKQRRAAPLTKDRSGIQEFKAVLRLQSGSIKGSEKKRPSFHPGQNPNESRTTNAHNSRRENRSANP